MAIDEKTVAKISKLARIRVEASEHAALAQEISGIMGWIEQLQEVNTDDVMAMTSVATMALPQRADVVTEGNARDAILKNAPISEHGCFVVPKVIE